MKRVTTALIFVVLIAMAGSGSCVSKPVTPSWEWPDPELPVPAIDKPRYIWVDASANFPDFANSKENIARDLALAKDAGFTDIVVDVRPTTGDVLFNTTIADRVNWLGAWVNGAYTKVERTATWDYLQAFIDECRRLDLRIHGAINTFTGGNTTSLGNQGMLFRDQSRSGWATQLNTSEGIKSTMEISGSAKFFNPVLPEVQDYICNLLADLAAYDLDGIILDRGRFDGFDSDFSNKTRLEFEKYIGGQVADYPADILPAGASTMPNPMPKHLKRWIEFRAKVIHDFIVKASSRVKSVNPDIKFGAYVGGWYSSYYDVGVNWGSPNYNASLRFGWATAKYSEYGYADHIDQLLIGAYAAADKIYGTTEWTMEGFCRKAMEYTAGDVPIVAGGPDVGNWKVPAGTDPNKSVELSVGACLNACDGYFLFDMIHLKQADQWRHVKKGIDAAIDKR